MKILINATSVGHDNLTGIERFSLRISQELYRIDPCIKIVSTRDLPGVSNVTKPRLLGLGKHFLARKEYLLRAVWDQTVFRYQAMKYRADVVFFPMQDGMLRPPMSQIVTVHDLHYQYFDRTIPDCRNEIGRLRTNFYRFKMPHILAKSAAVVAVSESTKQDLVNCFYVSPDKVHVVYNGYDDARFKHVENMQPVLDHYGLKPREYILFVGSILKHKNLLRLIDAFAKLKQNVRLVVAGSCKDTGYLYEILKASEILGVRNRFLYLEYVPDDDLPSLYSGALTFILPSLHEGFGVPLIEAMACGTPVITSNCSAMPEVAGDSAVLVDPYSVDSIASAMHEILNNHRRADSLRQAGLERAKSFSWSASARKLYSLCEMISGSKPQDQSG